MEAKDFVGSGCGRGLGDPIVWLEKRRNIVMKESVSGDYLLVPLSAVGKSGFSAGVLNCVGQVVLELGGISAEDVLQMEALRYLDDRRFVRPGVGIFPKKPDLFNSKVRQEIGEALMLLFDLILEGRGVNILDSIFSMGVKENSRRVVNDVAEGFLRNNKLRSAGEEMILKTGVGEIFIKGNYRSGENLPLPELETRELRGEIDGIVGRDNFIYIILDDGRVETIYYDRVRFEKQLRDKVLDRSIYKFDIERDWIGQKKSVDYLLSFELCSKKAPHVLI